jgi:solute carrier family 25 phosphate transporter 23/24/25/41/solute carrier family 25 protein 16
MPNTYENIGKIEEARWRFFSGFCGGILSRTCIAPIERYIILRQTGSQTYLGKHWKEIAVIIYNKEGPSSFFKGNGANCMRVGPF